MILAEGMVVLALISKQPQQAVLGTIVERIEFELTATDYLVAFCLLAVLIISRGHLWGSGGVAFVVQMIVVFYACELLITEKRSGWSWLSISSMAAGVILGVRGLFLG